MMTLSKTQSITPRLILGFCVLFSTFFLFGIYALYSIHKVSDLNQRIYNHPLVVSNAALQANVSIAKMHRNMKDVVLFHSSSRIHQAIDAVNKEEKQVYQQLNIVKNNILGEEGRLFAETAQKLFDEWRPIRNRVIDLVDKGQQTDAAEITIGKGANHVALLEIKMLGLTDYARKKASKFNIETENIRSELNLVLISFLTLGIFISLLVAFFTLRVTSSSEKALQRSEERYRSLIEGQTDLVCCFKSDGEFVFVNDMYAQFFNKSKTELIGSNWQPLPVDDDVEIIKEKLSTLSSENPIVTIENRVLSGRGQIHWIQFVNHGFFDNQGGLLEIQSVGRDITEQKQAEKELKEKTDFLDKIIETAALSTWISDENGTAIRTNPASLEFFGATENEVIGKYNLFQDDVILKKGFTTDIREVFEKGNTANIVMDYDFSSVDHVNVKNAAHRTVNSIFTPIKDASGKVSNVIVQTIDLTDIKRMEKELIQSRKMESIGNLAGGIAHEFNNMLSIIIGNNELIMEELPEWSLARENTEEIRIAGMRARDVVKQLLTFSRQDNAVKKVMNFKSVVHESMKLIRSSTPTNIEIRQILPDDVYPVLGNETQINQLLINLSSNAVDAMPATGGLLTIELLNETINKRHHSNLKPGQYVKLVVSDNGIGMDKETIDRIFEPYYTTKEIGKGSGIGLAVVHGIIERHGGSVIANSLPGKGSVFTFFFPLYKGPLDEKKEKNIAFPTGDEYILYVDDEPAIAQLGKRHLEALGYTAESTTDPLNALAMVKADIDKFDLVISDMAMPSMTGDQLLTEILKIRPDMATIICTGYSAKFSEKDGENMGVGSFAMKPLDKAELAKKIRQVLDNKKAIKPDG